MPHFMLFYFLGREGAPLLSLIFWVCATWLKRTKPLDGCLALLYVSWGFVWRVQEGLKKLLCYWVRPAFPYIIFCLIYMSQSYLPFIEGAHSDIQSSHFILWGRLGQKPSSDILNFLLHTHGPPLMLANFPTSVAFPTSHFPCDFGGFPYPFGLAWKACAEGGGGVDSLLNMGKHFCLCIVDVVLSPSDHHEPSGIWT